jgi:DNA-binding transcriptional ArsR family regulator
MRRNPLYNAFKAKSFTSNDIVLHFCILDILANGGGLTAGELVAKIEENYLFSSSTPYELDESTVRKKLKEYVAIGLLRSEKAGRQVVYSRADTPIDLNAWRDALIFYSEVDPLGVVGSYLLDTYRTPPDSPNAPNSPSNFGFKHHYILHAMESEILCALLDAICGESRTELRIHNARRGKPSTRIVLPLFIYVSVQNGRRYLLAYHYHFRKFMFYRLDSMRSVKTLEQEPEFEKYKRDALTFRNGLWGVSSGKTGTLDHVEMTIRAEEDEGYILQRLEREKRLGKVENAGKGTYRFVADVYDATEMLPWIRTFIGRIVDLRCSNRYMTDTFRADLKAMETLYGGGSDAVL